VRFHIFVTSALNAGEWSYAGCLNARDGAPCGRLGGYQSW